MCDPHILLAAVSFEDDKYVVSSSKSPPLLLESIQSDPGLKVPMALLLTELLCPFLCLH
jgi:hypothetical protein